MKGATFRVSHSRNTTNVAPSRCPRGVRSAAYPVFVRLGCHGCWRCRAVVTVHLRPDRGSAAPVQWWRPGRSVPAPDPSRPVPPAPPRCSEHCTAARQRGDKFAAVAVRRGIVSALLAGLDEVIMPLADGAISRAATILARFADWPPGGRPVGVVPAQAPPAATDASPLPPPTPAATLPTGALRRSRHIPPGGVTCRWDLADTRNTLQCYPGPWAYVRLGENRLRRLRCLRRPIPVFRKCLIPHIFLTRA